MSNEEKNDNFSDNVSDRNSTSTSDSERNDTAQNQFMNSSQTTSENHGNFILNASSESQTGETNTIEIREMSSDDSSPEVLGSVQIIYEFPDDTDTNLTNKSTSKSQKRHNAVENDDLLAKKSRNDRNNDKSRTKTNASDEKHSSTPEKKSKDRNQHRNKGNDINENICSNEIIFRRRCVVKPVHRSSKDNEMQPNVKTIIKTSEYNDGALPDSLSDGALADVEDNADSTSNEDVRNDTGTKYQASTSNAIIVASDIASGSCMSESNFMPSTDCTSAKSFLKNSKDPIPRNQPKAIKKSVKAESGSNISSKTPSGKEKEATTSSTANKLKKKSDTARRNKRKCFVCNKKLGLTAITCRCGGLFCSVHRYDKEHDCSFDYKSMGAEEIRKNNPLIIAEKIPKL
ncbi:zinc finger A20 and AN1 domain-containing stress-associated protein 9 [Nephila pilipes]|uniref:Zinc finger A20 and AN1 domain-containing stress-associated protein 9 n=1 Tax=Nephila pilipes TaxID=299642 RepID=A0A8X6UQD1_NEPPI|nr:zinc finger A20 and AN1 domain-containing stress-associated protein 9 [Nephila pilipes]